MGSRAKVGLCSSGASSLTPALLPPPPPSESELSWNLDGLRADLSDLKSRGERLGRNMGVGARRYAWICGPPLRKLKTHTLTPTPLPLTQPLKA